MSLCFVRINKIQTAGRVLLHSCIALRSLSPWRFLVWLSAVRGRSLGPRQGCSIHKLSNGRRVVNIAVDRRWDARQENVACLVLSDAPPAKDVHLSRFRCVQKADAPYPEINEDPVQDIKGNRKNSSQCIPAKGSCGTQRERTIVPKTRQMSSVASRNCSPFAAHTAFPAGSSSSEWPSGTKDESVLMFGRRDAQLKLHSCSRLRGALRKSSFHAEARDAGP